MAGRRGSLDPNYKQNAGLMSVIMGGSGSTGSSLVKNILNRHPKIFAGEETSLFAKEMIYDDWSKAKKRVVKRKLKGLKNKGYHIYNGTDMIHKEYGHTKKEISEMAVGARSLRSFCDLFYEKPLNENGADIWIEKTPANAACFTQFLDHFENGKVIHMVRNPYDTIASLWDRGYDLHYAVGIYLLNTACGLSADHYIGRCHTIKYEDVINRPDVAISEACRFLGVQFSADMLSTKKEQIEVSRLSGWHHDETANIGTHSLGRFERMTEEKKRQVKAAIAHIEVSEAGKGRYGISHFNIRSLCHALDYRYEEVDNRTANVGMRKALMKDRLDRLKRGYPTGIYYPLALSSKDEIN